MQLALKSIFKFSQIGFVGLGNMGFPMAINLAKRGHKVFAFDIDHSKAEEALKHGITFRREVQLVAKDADVFVTMLPNSEHSQNVCESEGGTNVLR
jgi:3-hydroxyisobutyrate dehydrogenase